MAASDRERIPPITGYRILHALGEGGMGTVYLAEEEALGRHVAIKVISERFADADAGQAGSRFLREARAMATVEHPCVVRVYTFGQNEGKAYLVMEYVEGEVLADRITRLGALSLKEALQVLRQVVEALEAAWDKHIVHRDIKPSNILLDTKNRVHVADFGLAKPIEMKAGTTLTGEGSILGTPHYISPEQALGRSVDFRSDIYSLGIVFYEMLTGEKPFEGTTPFEIVNQHLNATMPSLAEKRQDAPRGIGSLLEWMTQKDPRKRPDSYRVLLEAIDSLIGVRTPTPISSMETMAGIRPKTFSLRAAGLLAVTLAILVGAWFLWNRTLQKTPEVTQETPDENRLVVAVTPFYGPDEDSANEGRVMSALVEKAIEERLGKDVKVIGMEETKAPVRDHESARRLGERLHATAVIWGEAFALRKETEIQPYLTMTPQKKMEAEAKWERTNLGEDPFAALPERSAQAVVVQAEAPNQIELRKTSAAGIGDIVLFLAGMHALYREEDAQKALSLFQQAPDSAESLQYRAQALLQLGKKDDAFSTLQQAAALDPRDAHVYALLGDLYMEAQDFQKAVAAYRTASQTESSFVTHRAILFDDVLYTKEFFQSKKYSGFGETEGGELETAYFLALSPDTGKVLERYHLPGVVKEFSLKNNSLTVLYDAGVGSFHMESEVPFSHGTLGRSLPTAENLTLRIQSMEGGWQPAANFMSDLEKNEYVSSVKFGSQSEIVYNDAPQTLQDLESALRVGREKDPSQPWYLFFLGQTLWSKGEKQEAAKTWEKLFAEDFSSVPYYEFAWMASFFERLGQREWADKAYREALEHRKRLAEPVEYTTLLERLVNANFIRQAAWSSQRGMDLERAYQWLLRARELTGISLEGDDFAAAAWEKYFRSRGELAPADREHDFFLKAQSNPFNIIRATTAFDYAFNAFVAATVSLLMVSALLFIRAAKICAVSQEPANKESRPLKVAVLALFVGGLLSFGLMEQGLEVYAFMAAFFLSLILYLRSRHITFVELVRSVSLQGRAALLLAFFIFLTTLCASIVFNHRVQSLFNSPPQIADSTGNAALVQEMEGRLKQADTKEARYAAAAVNQMAGNGERARELYQPLAGDSRSQKNVAALEKGEPIPAESFTTEDLYRAYVSLPWRGWLERLWQPGTSLNIFVSESHVSSETPNLFSFLFRTAVLIGIILFVLFLRVSPRQEHQLPRPKSNAGKAVTRTVYLATPGFFDLSRGSPLVGCVTFTLFAFALFTFLAQWLIPHRFPVPGIVTLLQMPNYLNSVPFPTPPALQDMDARVSFHYWTIFWAYPYAHTFWTIVALAGAVSISLHVSCFPRIWRSL